MISTSCTVGKFVLHFLIMSLSQCHVIIIIIIMLCSSRRKVIDGSAKLLSEEKGIPWLVIPAKKKPSEHVWGTCVHVNPILPPWSCFFVGSLFLTTAKTYAEFDTRQQNRVISCRQEKRDPTKSVFFFLTPWDCAKMSAEFFQRC